MSPLLFTFSWCRLTLNAVCPQIRQLNEQLEAQEAQFLGHQADLEVLEAKHKDLEANIATLLVEKHALQVLPVPTHCFTFHSD